MPRPQPMEVSKAQLVEVEHSITHLKDTFPATFFSLDASEQMKYNAFRSQRNDLEKVLQGLPPQEQERKEKAVQDIFLDLTAPYLKQGGVEAARCFAYYGDDKKTLLETPLYDVYEDKPFSMGVQITYWFSTNDQELSCTSKLNYKAKAEFPERTVVYDLLRKCGEQHQQDGTTFPLVKFKGDFMYFASTDFAVPLMSMLKVVLKKIGLPVLRELQILHDEYMRQRSYGQVSNTSLQQKVFEDAYEQRFEIELLKAGLKQQKLVQVQ